MMMTDTLFTCVSLSIVMMTITILQPSLSFQVPPSISRHAAFKPTFVTTTASSSSSSSLSATASTTSTPNSQKTVIIAGATGYIGKSVVQESIRRGYNTIALVRNATYLSTPEGQRLFSAPFSGATIRECDVSDADAVREVMASCSNVDTVISCLASRSGTKREAQAVDYEATLNCLNAGRSDGVRARHFVLLSAYCVQKPLLELQRAKLRFEAKLQAQSEMTYSIVRPTAFMKSISGQLEGIQQGAPYVLFGDGAVTRCNPISEVELAEYMIDCMTDESRKNKILNIGGPDRPLTNQMLGEMMYGAINQPPKFVYAPTWIFDAVIATLDLWATITKSEAVEDAAETARIGKYYAVEDMLTTDPSEKYGRVTVKDHYESIAAAGQDPFTPVRATAVIGKVIEAAPAFLFMLPLAWTASHPQEILTKAAQLDYYPMMLAAIKDINILSVF